MSNDSKLITIYISQNKTDILTKIPIIAPAGMCSNRNPNGAIT